MDKEQKCSERCCYCHGSTAPRALQGFAAFAHMMRSMDRGNVDLQPRRIIDARLRWFRRQRLVSLVLIPIGIFLFAIAFSEHLHSRPKPSDRLVTGTITNRTLVRKWLVAKRPEFSI